MNKDLEHIIHRESPKTPLKRWNGDTPPKTRIWVKEESENEHGNHYSRVFGEIIRRREQSGELEPHSGQTLLETTSGSAGAALASIASQRGYNCEIIMPPNVEDKREEAITSQGANLIYTHDLIDDLTEQQATQEYVNAFPAAIKQYIQKNIRAFKSGEAVFLNHSMGPKENGRPTPNQATLDALEAIWYEATQQLEEAAREKFDAFIPAIGNGSSVTGPCRAMNNPDQIHVAGFETVQSAAAYQQMHPGRFKERFGIEPGTLKRHNLPGTSYSNNKPSAKYDDIEFPHLTEAVQTHLDDIILVSGAHMDKDYEKQPGSKPGKTKGLPHWDDIPARGGIGRSTRGGIAAAERYLAKQRDKKSEQRDDGAPIDCLVLQYDTRDKYDKNK